MNISPPNLLQVFAASLADNERLASALVSASARPGYRALATSCSRSMLELIDRQRIESINYKAAKEQIEKGSATQVEFFGLDALIAFLPAKISGLVHLFDGDDDLNGLLAKMRGKWPKRLVFCCASPDQQQHWAKKLGVSMKMFELVPPPVGEFFESSRVNPGRLIPANNLFGAGADSLMPRILMDLIDVPDSAFDVAYDIALRLCDDNKDQRSLIIFHISSDAKRLKRRLATNAIEDYCRVVVAFNDRPALLKAIDLALVFGDGNKINQGVIEAMAMGRRIITGAGKWSSFALGGAGSGWLLDKFDQSLGIAAVQDALSQAAKDRRQMEETCVARASSIFRQDKVQAKIVSLL